MNGAGNDFIILNNFEEHLPVERLPQIARTLCERRMSIGADGLMVVDAPTCGGDYRMRFYNSDGSVGEMCGNGARCICRYGYENGLAGETQTVETTAGIVTGRRMDRRLYGVESGVIAKALSSMRGVRHRMETVAEVNGVTYDCSYVELGDPGIPHAVVPYHGLKNSDENALRELGRAIRWNPSFPKGANVNFYEIVGEDRIFERTFERGVEDFTYACGTGTGSVVTVLTLQGRVSGRGVQVDMTGGRLVIDAEREGSRIAALYLTGPTNVVCKGEVTDEDLIF